MSTTVRRISLIAACVFVLVMVVGLVAVRRDASRTHELAPQTTAGTAQLRIPAETTKNERVEAPATGADPSAAKPVVIARVMPWVEIARRSQYMQGGPAERRGIRDLYWKICVEDRIPVAQRESAYWQFVRDSEQAVSESADPARARPLSPYLREHQAVAPSPVDPGTMRSWCRR